MAIKANIIIDQGTDFSTTIDVTNEDGDLLDLTGYSGAAQMRRHYTSSNCYSFTVAVSTAGYVTLSLSSNTTKDIPYGRYVYDCELTDASNTVSRLVEGIVTITPGVTR